MLFAKDLYVLCAFIAAALNEIHGKITLLSFIHSDLHHLLGRRGVCMFVRVRARVCIFARGVRSTACPFCTVFAKYLSIQTLKGL